MKTSSRSACHSALLLGLLLGGASACGSSDSGLSNGSTGGSAGVTGSAQAGSGSLGGQSQSSSGGSANAGAGPSAAAGSAAGGSLGASGSSSGGSSAAAGSASQAGSTSQAGSAGQTGSAGSGASAGAAGGGATTAHFSFFVTSLEAIRRESKNQNGYGGNLGGLTGADAICTRIAEAALAGSGAKGWKAFLSTSKENAIDRIGKGPWYD